MTPRNLARLPAHRRSEKMEEISQQRCREYQRDYERLKEAATQANVALRAALRFINYDEPFLPLTQLEVVLMRAKDTLDKWGAHP